MEKKSRRNRSDYGEDFVAPDGGWGWLVSIAAGVSFVTVIGFIQNFGLLFRDRMNQIGLENSQITAIGNTQVALSSCTGLFNGPMFRRYTYRQVGIIGSILSTVGVFLTSFASSFITFFIPYSILFGFGMGFVISAATLALNTYFKERRPTSSSIAWAIAGLGPVFLPMIIGVILPLYGYLGTMLLCSVFTLHNLPSALVFQPVLWHVKKAPQHSHEEKLLKTSLNNNDCDTHKGIDNNNSIENNNNENEKLENSSALLIMHAIQENDDKLPPICGRRKTNSFSINDDKQSIKSFFVSTEDMVQLNFRKSHDPVLKHPINLPANKPTIPWTQRVIKYFDLDLFKDFTYVNFSVGLTLTAFSEINIALLTPFFLSDFKFTIKEITIVMSALGITDLVLRLSTSYISSKLKWSGPCFYICGVLVMVFSRAIIAISQDFNVVLAMFIIMGIGKAWRTIFLNLVIASHIELNRLPAAQGLQLLTQGIFTLTCGPLVGLIRDATNYKVTIHILNTISTVPMLLWMLEILYKKYRRKEKVTEEIKI